MAGKMLAAVPGCKAIYGDGKMRTVIRGLFCPASNVHILT